MKQEKIESTSLDYANLVKENNGPILNLRNRNINDQGAEEIANALKENNSITKVDLSENPINNNGVQAICDMLRDNKSIKEIGFSDIWASTTFIYYAVLELLKYNFTLRKVDHFELIDELIEPDLSVKEESALERNKALAPLLEVANNENITPDEKWKLLSSISRDAFELYEQAYKGVNKEGIPILDNYISRHFASGSDNNALPDDMDIIGVDPTNIE